jgi:hypothetical protein
MNNFYVKIALMASAFMLVDASILNKGEPDYAALFAQLNESKDHSDSPWKIWSQEENEKYYTELKDAVFAKMGTSFTEAFNRKYPKASENSIKYLAQYIDALSGWQESCPPQATATIGSKQIHLTGDIANIIYDMNDIGFDRTTDHAITKVIWFEMKLDDKILSLLQNEICLYDQAEQERYEREIMDKATAIIKAVETSDRYIIYIKRPEMFFYRDKNPLFMIGSYNHYGGRIYVRHSENGCDNGEFLLPGPVAREFCSNDKYIKPIESVRLSEDEIELIIPKDTDHNRLYDWWYGKRGKFSRIDMLDEPAVLSPIPPAYAFLMNVCNRILRR